MILYSNGCSFTWGGNLYNFRNGDNEEVWLPRDIDHPLNKERLSVVYPAHLQKLLGATRTVNQSMGCGSNHRIVRTTLDYFYDLLLANKSISDHFVTIQWTEISRTEFHDELENNWHMISVYNGTCEEDPDKCHISNDLQELYYKRIYSDLQAVKTFISQVTCLGSFFEKHKIPYIFFTSINFWYESKCLTDPKLDKILSGYNWYSGIPSQSFMAQRVDSHSGAHPSKLGHVQWAELLYKDIIKQKIICKGNEVI